MINKPPHFIVDENDPFDGDPLDRKLCAENLTRLIAGSETPLVMSVSAPWGQGKTTFIKMWQAHLKLQGYTTIYFDAWENDFADDPLISFIGALDDLVEQAGDGPTVIKAAYDKVKKGIVKVVKASPKVALNWALKGGMHYITDDDPNAADEIEAVSSLAANMMVAELNKQKSVRKQIDDFKKSLAEFAAVASSNGKPLVVFIDELDRCRPDYTIELLERIKHLFSVEGVIFILSVDRDRLGCAAASQIGFSNADGGADADGYLRRFIDLDYYLPEPRSAQYFSYCGDNIALSDCYKGYFLEDWKFYGLFANYLGLSLRVQQQIVGQLKVVSDAYPDIGELYAKTVLLYLLISTQNRGLAYDALHDRNNGLSRVDDMLNKFIKSFAEDTRDRAGAEWIKYTNDRVIKGEAGDKEVVLMPIRPQKLANTREMLWRMIDFSEQFRL